MATRQILLQIAVSAVLAASSGVPSGASAATFKSIHSFCLEQNCVDGAYPRAGLVADKEGNLFGTTSEGGDVGINGFQNGTVFELSPNAKKTKWKFKRLWSFCSQNDCSDGSIPRGALIADINGNLYGTASKSGGTDENPNGGIVFELIHNAKSTKWNLKVLHAFCPEGDEGCSDGQSPFTQLTYSGASSGALYDGTSPLYGTTVEGGNQLAQGGTLGGGTVFKVYPSKGGGSWTEQVLYDFCGDASCSKPLPPPSSGLVVDGAGGLYGTVDDEGFPGTLYELVPNAKKTKWKLNSLYTFCSLGNCADGTNPEAALLDLDATGTIYGTTLNGGSGANGVVYKVEKQGKGASLTVLHSFCQQQNCTDGAGPRAGVVTTPSGALFGTTDYGGTGGQFDGTVFEIGESFSVVHSFCSEQNCIDGDNPLAGLILDQNGNLFGTTSSGGKTGTNGFGNGTIYEVVP